VEGNKKLPSCDKGTWAGKGRDRSEQESQSRGRSPIRLFAMIRKRALLHTSLARNPSKPICWPDLPWIPATRKQTEYYQSFSHWAKTICLINLLIGFLDTARIASDVMRG
jgi:hypothetical protein